MILNLAYPENSPIDFKISKFPDGQQTIDINNPRSVSQHNSVTIKSRLNNFRDLELIICANQALKNLGVETIHLYVPYFIGARSDRKFQDGGVHYIKQVIAPIINNQNFKSVTVIDPHSNILEACINNLVMVTNFNLVKYALTKIDNKNGERDRICLVSPDAGAYKKIFDVAKEFKIENIITATKVRDVISGKILRTEIPVLDQHNNLSYVIIDDICDGGRTFIQLATALKQKNCGKIYLIVTHGIFSNGYDSLSENIDGIFCTNSVKDIMDGEILFTSSEHKTIHSFVKQINVF